MLFRRTVRSSAVVLATTLLVLPIAAHADDSWYVGAGVGLSNVDEFGIDEDDTGFKLFGGYHFNEFFGVEAAYVDLGELEEASIAGGPLTELEVDGFSLAAVGRYPITNAVSIHGKAGVYFWDADIVGSIAPQFNDDSDNDIFFGAGISYRFYERFTVIGEWERYDIDDFDIDLLSIGVSYSF